MAKVILGIDPGLIYCGYAILNAQGKSIALSQCSVIKLKPRAPLEERVGILFEFFAALISEHQVTDIALETSFLGRNAQVFLKLGYVRGALYVLAHQHKLTLHEYAPRQIKQSVSGFGNASKEQVAFMMRKLFPMLAADIKNDATDALAAALCAAWHSNNRFAQEHLSRRRR